MPRRLVFRPYENEGLNRILQMGRPFCGKDARFDMRHDSISGKEVKGNVAGVLVIFREDSGKQSSR